MTNLNNLSGKAQAKLSKSVWASQKQFATIKQEAINLQTSAILHSNSTLDNSIDESRVRLIELLTCEQQLVCDLFDANKKIEKAAEITNRQYTTKLTSKVNLVLSELLPFNFKQNNISYNEHLALLKSQLEICFNTLKPKSHIAIIARDQRYQNRYYCRHGDVARLLEEAGFTLQGIITIIKDNKPLHAHGYPATFVPNIINEFSVIARR